MKFLASHTSTLWKSYYTLCFATILALYPSLVFAQQKKETQTTSSFSTVNDDVKVVECHIPFKVNTWNVDVAKLQRCFEELDVKKIQSFDVYASASPDGNVKSNLKLAENRRKAIATQLNNMFPSVKINSKSGGQSRSLMRSALIVAVMRSTQVTQATVLPPASKACPVVEACPIQKACPAPKPIPPPVYEKYGLEFWAGVEFVFVPDPLAEYVYNPFYGFEIGFKKDFINLPQKSELYLSGVFDYGNSSRDSGVDSSGNTQTAIYYFANVQALVGLEHQLWGDILAGYIDVGPVIQQRSFILRTASSSIDNYYISTTLGVSGNAGLNLYYNYSQYVSYFLKLNVNAMIGVPKEKTVSSQTINTNPYTWAPSLSLGVRI